jgi:hypothetical protein
MSKLLLPNAVDIRDVIANLNSFAADPSTSRGRGEIIFQTTASVLKVNTQSTNPKTNPTWEDVGGVGGGGLANVVEDLTPQLGGDLDCNTKKITGVTEIQTTTSILFKKV